MVRGDYPGKLKGPVVEWINDLYEPSDPALRANSKHEWGLGNDNTGRLLYDWDNMRSVK